MTYSPGNDGHSGASDSFTSHAQGISNLKEQLSSQVSYTIQILVTIFSNLVLLSSCLGVMHADCIMLFCFLWSCGVVVEVRIWSSFNVCLFNYNRNSSLCSQGLIYTCRCLGENLEKIGRDSTPVTIAWTERARCHVLTSSV